MIDKAKEILDGAKAKMGDSVKFLEEAIRLYSTI